MRILRNSRNKEKKKYNFDFPIVKLTKIKKKGQLK